MKTFNPDTTLKTKVAKNGIQAFAIVKVVNPLDYQTKCIVEDKFGNRSEYLAEELTCFSVFTRIPLIIEITEEIKKADNHTNIRGYVHYTPNVRSTDNSTFTLFNDFLYTNLSDYFKWYEYPYRELTDEEASQILLDEIIYGDQPNLQSISCVGTDLKGIDKDPNYRNGYYLLPNNKKYTVTWCYGSIIIREGIDGGWYQGSKEPNTREIYSGTMDWPRHKEALIRQHCVRQLQKGAKLIDEIPEVGELIYQHIKNQERFKLSTEFEINK
jgi:hypothetical protein